MTTKFTSRSAIETYQRCPRQRYLEYSLMGTGVRKIRQAIPLATGGSVHAGLESLLNGIDTEVAVEDALQDYNQLVATRGLDVEVGEDAQFVMDEQRALIEALVRVWALRGMKWLTDKYEVLEVEREEHWPAWTSCLTRSSLNPTTILDIDFLARADSRLRERSTGDLYLLSFKTAASWDHRREDDARHDVQGLSEVAAVEHRTGERLMGVQMAHLIKGRRDQDETTGRYRTQSHLIGGWTREGVTDREYAWRYKWSGPDVWIDTGRLRGHTLGKGWTRFNAWEAVGGVKAWIELLASGTVQPDVGDPFDQVLVMPLPYFRQDRDVEDWLEQSRAQEAQVARDAEAVELVRLTGDATALRHELNRRFPQNRRSCSWPSRCQFLPTREGGGLCFCDDSVLLNPFANGYERREAHHPAEAAALKEKV